MSISYMLRVIFLFEESKFEVLMAYAVAFAVADSHLYLEDRLQKYRIRFLRCFSPVTARR